MKKNFTLHEDIKVIDMEVKEKSAWGELADAKKMLEEMGFDCSPPNAVIDEGFIVCSERTNRMPLTLKLMVKMTPFGTRRRIIVHDPMIQEIRDMKWKIYDSLVEEARTANVTIDGVGLFDIYFDSPSPNISVLAKSVVKAFRERR